VPVTGNKNDRLQTSTCSVAILPKARDLEMSLPAKDLKYEFMRSSGAGGQGVNTTDSACRLTHLPTGQFSVQNYLTKITFFFVIKSFKKEIQWKYFNHIKTK
jgi:protein subunit release factor A